MKYIRTKDKILLMNEDYYFDTFNKKKVIVNSYGYSEQVIKEADTIEELCDEFVMIDEENEHYIKQDNDIHHIRRKWAIGNYKVYGAIWTEKGLIYVTQLNEKGNLGLIWVKI